MPEVTVEVGGRSYRLGCGEGEEQHLRSLAARVDTEAVALNRIGQMAEGRLMLMSALMLADRLSEAERVARDAGQAIAEAEQRAAAAEHRATDAEHRAVEAEDRAARAGAVSPEREGEIAASLDALASRIDSLVGRIEGAGANGKGRDEPGRDGAA